MSIGQEISFRKISLEHLEMKFPFDNLDHEVTESENRLVLKTQLSNSSLYQISKYFTSDRSDLTGISYNDFSID